MPKINKGLLMRYFFLLFGLVFSIIIAGLWQQMGMSIASERMSELKVNTLSQVKDILFTLQYMPVETQACASLISCDKLTIHKTFIDIWGPTNDYFSEKAYVSTSLAGNMDLYYEDDTCVANEGTDCWVKIGDSEDDGFSTACGSDDQIVFICFKKVMHSNKEAICILKQEVVEK
jgi:hypothetical protein